VFAALAAMDAPACNIAAAPVLLLKKFTVVLSSQSSWL
jgi:hypothetical protein